MSTPIPTARRNLAGRIDRFLSRLDGEPDAYPGGWALRAVVHLQHQEWAAGEDAMLRAERPDLASTADMAAISPPDVPITRTFLREKLAEVLAEQE